jgi:hypothetical protein
MDKVIKILEQALSDAVQVEVLAIMDREHLNRAVGGMRAALLELRELWALDRKPGNTEGLNGAS